MKGNWEWEIERGFRGQWGGLQIKQVAKGRNMKGEGRKGGEGKVDVGKMREEMHQEVTLLSVRRDV